MRPNWSRYYRSCVAMSLGGVTLGILQGLSMVNFAQLFTEFLTQWLSVIVAALFGANLNTLLGTA
jgi:hypothetical protein